MWGIICDVGVAPAEIGEGFPPGFQYFRSASGPGAAMLFKGNSNTSCSGPEYIDFVMSWVDKEISEMKLSLNARARVVAETYLLQVGHDNANHCSFRNQSYCIKRPE